MGQVHEPSTVRKLPFVRRNSGEPALEKNLGAGGAGVTMEEGTRETVLGSLADLPLATEEDANSQSYVDTPPLPNGEMVGDYRIEGIIGQGGMGTVYGAVHPLIGKKAAVKVLRPRVNKQVRAVDRFLQEARAVNEIDHLNIIDIFAFGTLGDGRAYLVMERLRGETLGERLARSAIPLIEAAEYFSQICRALSAAHSKGVVHRDLKPDNVFLVERRGEPSLVKLLDFGIAKFAFGEFRENITASGVFVGTPAYVAPEQAKAREVTARSDIYALGVLMFEVLLGRRPFIADSPMGVVALHLGEKPPDPCALDPNFPKELGGLILRMLDKEPNQRPDLSEIQALLERIKIGAVVARTEPVRARFPVLAAIAAVGVAVTVALASAAVVGLGGDEGTESAPRVAAAAESADVAVPPTEGVRAEVAAPATGHVVLTLGLPDVFVYVDGQRLEVDDRRAEAELSEGQHEVVAVAPDQSEFRQTIAIVAGQVAVVTAFQEEVAVEPLPDKKKRVKKTAKVAKKSAASTKRRPAPVKADPPPKESKPPRSVGLGDERIDPFSR